MKQVDWKSQVPVHSVKPVSEFIYHDEIDRIKECPYLYLGQYEEGVNVNDLYVILSEGNLLNVICQYRDDPSSYTSGINFAYDDLIAKKETARTVAIERAVELGLIEEKSYFIGYSYLYDEKLFNDFASSEYMMNRPEENDDYMFELNDEEYFKEANRVEALQEAYDTAWLKKHGEIPVSKSNSYGFMFESEKEANEVIDTYGGFFVEIKAFSEEQMHSDYKRQGLPERALKMSLEMRDCEEEVTHYVSQHSMEM